MLKQSTHNTYQSQTFQVLATGHCTGLQTINRAELQAMVVAVEAIAPLQPQSSISFCTDSQYVANFVQAIEYGHVDSHPHKHSHWDLIQRLMFWWDPVHYTIIKIKSHRKVEDATSPQDCLNIWGNMFADEAAVKTRQNDLPEYDQLCSDVRQHYIQQKKLLPQIWQYMLDSAYQRLLKTEADAKYHKDLPMGLSQVNLQPACDSEGNNVDTPLTLRLKKYQDWTVLGEIHQMPPEPHQVVFWSCTWGINMSRLVWRYLTLLKWPRADAPHGGMIVGYLGSSLPFLSCYGLGTHSLLKFALIEGGEPTQCLTPKSCSCPQATGLSVILLKVSVGL